MFPALAAAFPTWYKLDIGAWFDRLVPLLEGRFGGLFDLISRDLLWFLNGLEQFMNLVPWCSPWAGAPPASRGADCSTPPC
jgi:ABC-type proline/glycine betaine transport system permease subunit